jgi:hypothetical protein
MVTVFVGEIAGQPVKIVVPEGWSGRVGLFLSVHRGQPSRRYQVVKETLVDPTKEQPIS